jgi:hypothetical protein
MSSLQPDVRPIITDYLLELPILGIHVNPYIQDGSGSRGRELKWSVCVVFVMVSRPAKRRLTVIDPGPIAAS